MAADLFCDEDLRACCPGVRIENYPHGRRSAFLCASGGLGCTPGRWKITRRLSIS